MDLHLDDDDLAQCVQCGLCLPHCPTYRVTGDETRSPRGRIRLMREVQDHDAPLTDEVLDAFDTCIQCRGCEPACPSGVPYGRLIEGTNEALTGAGHGAPWWQQLAMRPLASPTALRAGTTAMAAAQRTGLLGLVGKVVPAVAGLPADLPLSSPALVATPADRPAPAGEVILFTGCVMDAWQRDVHAAAQRVLEAAGARVVPASDLGAGCCGALHTHAGFGDEARSMGAEVADALAGDRPIVVDAAGCGAELLANPAVADRVVDVSTWVAEHGDRLPSAAPIEARVAIQDPCHLRHVQKAHDAVRVALAPFVAEVVELDDDGLCCGAGGAFSALQPDLAGDVRDRKLAALDRAAPEIVASANPGCSLHLAAGYRDRGGTAPEVVHPIQLIDRALQRAQKGAPACSSTPTD
ncbi:MAG: (Fe-S)-binding protein [Acidimicrobiales bacterium]